MNAPKKLMADARRFLRCLVRTPRDARRSDRRAETWL